MRSLNLFSLATAGVLLLGCGSSGGPDRPGDDDIDQLEYPPDTGQAAAVELPYAPGPYGMREGSVVPNLKFYGYHNSVVQMDEPEILQLASLYNPTGDGVWPEGTVKAGEPLPKYLLVIGAASW